MRARVGKQSPSTNESVSDAEQTLLPAGLLPLNELQLRLTLPSFRLSCSLPSFRPSCSLPSFLPSRSLDGELPHSRRSRSPTRYYDAGKGRHPDEEYLDDRCVLLVCVATLLVVCPNSCCVALCDADIYWRIHASTTRWKLFCRKAPDFYFFFGNLSIKFAKTLFLYFSVKPLLFFCLSGTKFGAVALCCW